VVTPAILRRDDRVRKNGVRAAHTVWPPIVSAIEEGMPASATFRLQAPVAPPATPKHRVGSSASNGSAFTVASREVLPGLTSVATSPTGLLSPALVCRKSRMRPSTTVFAGAWYGKRSSERSSASDWPAIDGSGCLKR
jgi:hypothetical protein